MAQTGFVREQALVCPYPITLRRDPTKGRHLVAARDLAPGEEVYCCWASAHSTFEAYHKRLCACCLQWGPRGTLPLCCRACNWAYYCSPQCQRLHHPLHTEVCAAHKTVTKADPKFGKGVAGMLRILLEIAHHLADGLLRDEAAEERRDVLASVRAQQRAQLDGAVRHVLDACAQRTAAESQDQTAVLDALIFKHMGISPPPQGPTDKEGPPDATCTADDGTDAGVKADTELPSEAGGVQRLRHVQRSGSHGQGQPHSGSCGGSGPPFLQPLLCPELPIH
uniref:MYND-type domain-containing protein n=1 Tax=Eutreptiella gymnastica TaxID=73025 RepID=A0A7S4G7Z4_9EUGL